MFFFLSGPVSYDGAGSSFNEPGRGRNAVGFDLFPQTSTASRQDRGGIRWDRRAAGRVARIKHNSNWRWSFYRPRRKSATSLVGETF